jgi:DNA-binding winged helix-turn-helix (wHTH) protein
VLGPEELQNEEEGRAMRSLFGNYVLDLQRYELHGAGVPIKLRRKVFQVLAYLLVHRHRVVSKQELFAHVWPDQFVGEATLTSCITALRKALGTTDARRASCARCTARAIAL